ncbi:MAG: hypothetical protein H0X16_07475 [Chloroflexi bacterium]|nr:hypothetical protein [Chloroflexota bacterium]
MTSSRGDGACVGRSDADGATEVPEGGGAVEGATDVLTGREATSGASVPVSGGVSRAGVPGSAVESPRLAVAAGDEAGAFAPTDRLLAASSAMPVATTAPTIAATPAVTSRRLPDGRIIPDRRRLLA